MKIMTGIILSTLCLSYSAVASANSIESPIEKCISLYDYKYIGDSHPANSDSNDAQKIKNYEVPNDFSLDNFQICPQEIIAQKIYDSEVSKLNAEDKAMLQLAETKNLTNEQKNKIEKIQDTIDDVGLEQYSQDYKVEWNKILDNKNKIQFNFIPKSITRAETCSDLKGKPDNSYEFCMGIRTFKQAECQDSYGNPCGSKYDKSINGYSLKEDSHMQYLNK